MADTVRLPEPQNRRLRRHPDLAGDRLERISGGITDKEIAAGAVALSYLALVGVLGRDDAFLAAVETIRQDPSALDSFAKRYAPKAGAGRRVISRMLEAAATEPDDAFKEMHRHRDPDFVQAVHVALRLNLARSGPAAPEPHRQRHQTHDQRHQAAELELDDQDAADFARLMALAPDPTVGASVERADAWMRSSLRRSIASRATARGRAMGTALWADVDLEDGDRVRWGRSNARYREGAQLVARRGAGICLASDCGVSVPGRPTWWCRRHDQRLAPADRESAERSMRTVLAEAARALW